MKIILFVLAASFQYATNLEINPQLTNFCKAIKSIGVVLASPINIQLLNEAFGDCIPPTSIPTSTYLINVYAKATSRMTRSSLIIAAKEDDISNQTHLSMNSNGRHLVAIEAYSTDKLNDLVKYFWGKRLIHVSFLVIDKTDILLQTFIPFNDEKCNDTTLKTINQYDKKAEKWRTNRFFPKKINFHRCSVNVTTHNNIVPYIVREEIVDGKRVLKGRVIRMIEALATSLNFTIELKYETDIQSWETCLLKLINNEADLFIGDLLLTLNRSQYLDFTVPIFFEVMKFVVPPGRRYTQIENLARAYDFWTWALIVAVLVLFALVVLIVSFESKKIQIYAFGANYRNAFMDILGIVVGITGKSMPLLNIPRIIIMKFVIFCLVMRTLYQGSLFNFLQSGGQVKPAQSINEMIDKGYKFYMLELYDMFLDLKRNSSARKVFANITEFDGILDKISDHNFKGTLMHKRSLMVYKNGLKNRNYTNLFCKEDLMTVDMVGYLPKNFYLTEHVNQRIEFFHTAGLINFWDRMSQVGAIGSTDSVDIRKPISLENLKGVFLIHIIVCTASTVCFAGEILFSLFFKKKYRQK